MVAKAEGRPAGITAGRSEQASKWKCVRGPAEASEYLLQSRNEDDKISFPVNSDMSNYNERERRIPTNQTKIDRAASGQLKREALGDVKKKIGSAPEPASAAPQAAPLPQPEPIKPTVVVGSEELSARPGHASPVLEAELDKLRKDPEYASELARKAEERFDRKWGTTDPSAPTEWGIMHTYDDN